MFIEAKNMDANSKMVVKRLFDRFRLCKAPKITIPEMALVTLISGE